jgi:putative addiction module antidote
MLEMRIRKVGNSLGVVLPKEVLSRLNVQDGDKVFLTEAPDGSYRITSYDPEFKKQLTIGKTFMARYRNTLQALAQ